MHVLFYSSVASRSVEGWLTLTDGKFTKGERRHANPADSTEQPWIQRAAFGSNVHLFAPSGYAGAAPLVIVLPYLPKAIGGFIVM